MAPPDCLTTFDLEGAVGSSSTVHLGSPLPVLATVHPAGALPIASASKVTLSAMALGQTGAHLCLRVAIDPSFS